MSIGKGSKSKLIWQQETSYKTAPTGGYRGLLFSSESMVENINAIQSEDIRSDRTRTAIRGGNIAAGGSISNELGILRSAIMLRNLLAASSISTATVTATTISNGSAYVRGDVVYITTTALLLVVRGGTYTDSSSGLASLYGAATRAVGDYLELGGLKFQVMATGVANGNHYVHTITAGTDFSTGGLAVEKQILGGSSSLYVLFKGCRIDSLDVQIPQEGIVKSNWNLVAATTSSGSSTNISSLGTITYPTDEPVSGSEAFVSFNAGQTVRPVREANFTISNQVDGNVYCVNERERREVPEGERALSGRVTTYFEDSTEYDYFKNETKVSVAFSFNNAGNFLTFEFPECKLTGQGTPQISGAGVMMASYDISAFRQSSSYDVRAIIKTMTAAASL